MKKIVEQLEQIRNDRLDMEIKVITDEGKEIKFGLENANYVLDYLLKERKENKEWDIVLEEIE
jgi:hypothetical protein